MGGFLCTYINGVYPLTVPDGANLLLSVNLSGLYSIDLFCFTAFQDHKQWGYDRSCTF